MPNIIRPFEAKPIYVWTDEMESEAETQLRNISRLPFVYHHVAAMPDVHYGKGATVGSVLALDKAVIPAAVGVDIGCGMAAVKTNLTSHSFGDGQVATLRHSIERGVPVGFNSHQKMNDTVLEELRRFNDVRRMEMSEKHRKQLGTLGGGNHFIELCTDENDTVWIMLHSGSRNLGKELAEVHIKRAQEIASKYFVPLPDKDLAFLAEGTHEFNNYIEDVEYAQEYAFSNRKVMLMEVIRNMRAMFPEFALQGEIINCHHNYISRENHFGRNVIVTRKGAIRARQGELGIIPGSMGTRSYIVEGLGNRDSFHSCSHGAGRRMSRAKARKTFTVEDLAEQTKGVECRKDADVIDEIPGAYKDVDQVMRNQQDLVKAVAVLKQFLCIKG